MTSKVIERNAEDIDETVLSFAEVKALATGDPRIKEKMDLDNDIARLRVLKSSHDNQKYSLQDSFTFKYPERVKNLSQILENLIKDREKRNMNSREEFSININGKLYKEREKAGDIIKTLYSKIPKGKEIHVGKYKGFDIYLKQSLMFESYELNLQGSMKHKVELGDSSSGNITRLENVLKGLDEKISLTEEKIEEYKRNIVNAKKEYDKPFPYEEEYKSKLKRQNELNQELDLDKKDDDIEVEGKDDELELDDDLEL